MNLRVISFSNQSLFMSSVLLSLLILIIVIFAYKLYQWQRYKLPPGPYPLPIIGNLHRVEPDTADCCEKWSRTYGPIMSVWFGSSLNVVVSSSELAKEVLKDRDEQLAHRYRNKPTDIMTQNGKKDLIWADYGPDYVKAKKVCALELFSPKRIEALRPIREDEVRTMIESIFIDCSHCTNSTTDDRNASKRLILRDYIGLATFNIITRLVFGKKLGDTGEQGLEFKAITEHELKHGASLIDHIWWLNWIIMLRSKAFSDHLARKDRLIRSIIDEHKMRKGKIGGYSEQHFVDALLSYQEKDGFSEETMKGLLWDLISAGIDTSAITVEWAMAELIKNSRVQNKLQQELDNVIGCNRTMSESDISKLPYLQCIVKEVLRLHPPTPLMLPHKASADVKVGGYDIPKGTIVHVNVRAIGHDPKKWKNPLKFWPERFLEEDVDMKGHDFRLLPFGAGRRMCPAAQLSINLVTSMIGHLVHHFWWSPPLGVEPEEIDMSGSPELVNYMKTPLQGVPILRLPTHLYKHIFN